MQKESLHLNGQIAELQRDVNAYAVLANNKDNYLLHLEQKTQQQQQLIHYYENLKIVKLYARVARFIKRLRKRT